MREKIFKSQEILPATEEKLREKYTTLEIELVTVESSPNELKQLLVVCRRIKRYSESTGPFESFKFVIGDDLHYTVYILSEIFVQGHVLALDDVLSLEIFQRLVKESQWFVCHGVANASLYERCSSKDAVHMRLPPDSVRHKDCERMFHPTSTKSSMCQPCVSLQYYLTSHKRKLEELSESDQIQRQSTSSTLPIEYLSPVSKMKRIKNMRRKIENLSDRLRLNSQQPVNICDEQNDELMQLVKNISDVGTEELEKIYAEADLVGEGKGDDLKSVWESDVRNFNEEQERNCEFE